MPGPTLRRAIHAGASAVAGRRDRGELSHARRPRGRERPGPGAQSWPRRRGRSRQGPNGRALRGRRAGPVVDKRFSDLARRGGSGVPSRSLRRPTTHLGGSRGTASIPVVDRPNSVTSEDPPRVDRAVRQHSVDGPRPAADGEPPRRRAPASAAEPPVHWRHRRRAMVDSCARSATPAMRPQQARARRVADRLHARPTWVPSTGQPPRHEVRRAANRDARHVRAHRRPPSRIFAYDSIREAPQMTTIATAVLAAIALSASTPTFADGKPNGSRRPPSSYAPGPHTTRHVYGSPIEPRIVGHAPASPRKHAPTKQSPGGAAHDPHDHKTPSRRSAPGPQPGPG
jgi:hypothetical protein